MTKYMCEIKAPTTRIGYDLMSEKARLSTTFYTHIHYQGKRTISSTKFSLLSLVFPLSNDREKDFDIFEKCLAIDDDSLFERKVEPYMPRKGVSSRKEYRKMRFKKEGYRERFKSINHQHKNFILKEHIPEINEHLNVNIENFKDLMQQLSKRKYGKIPKVYDTFSGTGIIPITAMIVGLEAGASDINVMSLYSYELIKTMKYENHKDILDMNDRIRAKVSRFDATLGGQLPYAYIYQQFVKCPKCGEFTALIRRNTIYNHKIYYKNGKYTVEKTNDKNKRVRRPTLTFGMISCIFCGKKFKYNELNGDKMKERQEKKQKHLLADNRPSMPLFLSLPAKPEIR